MNKQLGPNGGQAAPAQPAKPSIVDKFDFEACRETQQAAQAALQRVTDKYNEVLKRRYITDNVTVLQYAAVELANQEQTVRAIGLPADEASGQLQDLARRITSLLDMYKSMPVDPKYACEPSIQAFRRQVRLDGGMARLATAYQADLKAAYMSVDRDVMVMLPFGIALPRYIKPSERKENGSRTNLVDGQFAVSGPEFIDYILRAAIGGRMRTYGELNMFPSSPVSEFKVTRKAVLVHSVAICSVSALEMDPETSLDIGWAGDKLGAVRFKPFGGEWTRKTRGLPDSMKLLPVNGVQVVTWVPSEHFMRKSVRCRGADGILDLSGLCRKSLDPNWRLANKV